MSHFYGKLQGSRGQATRCGTKSSGLTVEASGWDIGGKVNTYYDETLGTDVVEFRLTRGSNRPVGTLIAKYTIDSDGDFRILST